jgi:hypothetical protein
LVMGRAVTPANRQRSGGGISTTRPACRGTQAARTLANGPSLSTGASCAAQRADIPACGASVQDSAVLPFALRRCTFRWPLTNWRFLTTYDFAQCLTQPRAASVDRELSAPRRQREMRRSSRPFRSAGHEVDLVEDGLAAFISIRAAA